MTREANDTKRETKTVPEDLHGSPLDGAVRVLFGVSWGRAREIVQRGKISVDGEVKTQGTLRVRRGAEVTFDPTARNARAAAALLPEGALVHVDPHVVVVEKPSGISTVPFDPEGMGASIARRAQPGEAVTLDERVRLLLAKREGKRDGRGGPPPTLGVVHRIDKETSGLVVFTRTWAAKKTLLQAFRFHHVHRRYLAIVHGEMRSKTIVSHFIEDRGDGLRGSVEARHGRSRAIGSEKTQRAVTHIEALEVLPGAASGGEQRCTLVACQLETGRTHQIRIHLSEDGHPLVGERVYVRRYEGALIPAPRLMLHAAELGFVHPATEREMRWSSEPPADMQEVLRWLRSGR